MRRLALIAFALLACTASRVVIVTSDGEGRPAGMSRALAWIDTAGTYCPNVHATPPGLTIPNHALLWGAGGPFDDRCMNFPSAGENGLGAFPYAFEVLRRDLALPQSAAVLVSGKPYLLAFNRWSTDAVYGGGAYQPTRILAESTPDSCGMTEGPDSFIMDAALAFLDTADCWFAAINLSFGDETGHEYLACVGQDTVAYLAGRDSAWAEQERLVLDRLVPFLATHPTYAAETILLWTADHGFHDSTMAATIPDWRVSHGHGWAEDSLSCAPICDGCDGVFLFAAGPNVRRGYVLADSVSHEDVGALVFASLGIEDPVPTGTVPNIFDALVVVPDATATRAMSIDDHERLYDASGRRVQNPMAARSGVYFAIRPDGTTRRIVVVR